MVRERERDYNRGKKRVRGKREERGVQEGNQEQTRPAEREREPLYAFDQAVHPAESRLEICTLIALFRLPSPLHRS